MIDYPDESAFELYFSKIYGPRWLIMRQAFSQPGFKIARRNLFFDPHVWTQKHGNWVGEELSFLPNCYHVNESVDLQSLDEILLPLYRMDPASVVAARALQVQPGDRVLDMCAAPGGKSLILIEAMCGLNIKSQDLSVIDLTGHFVANELSAKRRHRMMTVIKRYLPKEVRSLVRMRGEDGSRIGLHEKHSYDKILLDAPCSGERGLFDKLIEIQQWKEKRTKSFAIRQYALLASAFMALKRGGRLVYSTCSISPYENDGVIEKFIKRQKKRGGDDFRIQFCDQKNLGEATEYGTLFLPDKMGWGPIFFAVIEKLD